MKLIKKCPLFLLLLSTGLLFSIIGFGGLRNIYAAQEYDPVKAPVLSVMFTALNDEIYPWQIFAEKGIMTIADNVAPGPGRTSTDSAAGRSVKSAIADSIGNAISSSINETMDAVIKDAEENAAKEAAAGPGKFPKGRVEPLRESTREEYLNHISADIYGDVGVQRAAEYEFVTVDESYFDDALFIGDSRTVGLRDYTDLSEHADFYCETSLTIYKALTEKFKGKGTVEEALRKNTYGKVYIMVGVNELGQGTTEEFMEEYTKVVDRIHELAPEAKIFIQGIMRVTGKKHNSDAIFNNSNINARNNAIATLADNEQFFYIDVNEVICDEEGNLNAEYTHDQLHLLGMYNDLWKEFLMTRGVN